MPTVAAQKLLLPALLAALLGGCNQPLPENFDIAGLWCEGAAGVCLADAEDHQRFYLFSATPLPENPQIKAFAKIDLSPPEHIARSADGDQVRYYKVEELAELINLQLGALSADNRTVSLGALNLAVPAATRLAYQRYLLDKAAGEVDFFENKNWQSAIRSECESKLKDMLNQQNPALQNYFLRHNLYIGYDSWLKGKAKAAQAACLSGAATADAARLEPVPEREQNQVAAIRYLSNTEMQIGEQRFTRIPLSSLQERLRADDSQLQGIIASLAMEQAMRQSLAHLKCAAAGECDRDEFGAALAKAAEPKPVAVLAKPAAKTAAENAVQAENSQPAQPPVEALGNAEILQALFGNYNREQDSAVVKDLFLQGENQPPAEAFVNAETRVLWAAGIDFQGAPHKLVLLLSQPIGAQGRPQSAVEARPVIGAALLGKTAGGWQAVVSTPYIVRAVNADDVRKPEMLEPLGEAAWLLRLESAAPPPRGETLITTLIALLPAAGGQAAAFVSPLALPTRSVERGADCPDGGACKVQDTRLGFVRAADGPLPDLLAVRQGYIKGADGGRAALRAVDYYAYTGREYERDIFKSAVLTQEYRRQACRICFTLGRLDWPYFE